MVQHLLSAIPASAGPLPHLYTDTSGFWGCGVWVSPLWFNLVWQGLPTLQSIALKELFPVVLACSIWGNQWQGLYTLCHWDNQVVVSQINSLHAQDPFAAHFLRCLAFFQTLFDFQIRTVHISRHLNVSADDLSRNRPQQFLATHPTFSPLPTQVPPWSLDLLLSLRHLDWTSLQVFSNFWMQV